MDKLAKNNREEALDVLAERLAFERTGVQLYDRILEVMERSNDEKIKAMLDQMEEYRYEEKEHEEWLEQQICALGGDPNAKTQRVRLIETESEGIVEVILKSNATVSEMFHALLAAELVDNAGWALLMQLAGEAGDDNAKAEFKRRMLEEAEHLMFVRDVVQAFLVQEVLGEQVQFPTSA